MNVGIDAGPLSITDDRLKTGVYRVAREMLTHLISDTDHSYRLYSFRKLDKGLFQPDRRVKNIILSPPAGYMKIRLPLELRVHPVDVFLGIAQTIPHVQGIPKAAIVYDVGFLHSPDAYKGSYKRLVEDTTYVARNADAIVCISEATKHDFLKHFPYAEGKCTAHHLGVNEIFRQPVKLHSPHVPYFLYVGALKVSKNIPLALKAFAGFLAQARTPYEFLLAGGNFWPDPAIEDTVRKLNLTGKVKFLGVISDEDLASYYDGATALVSLSRNEGFCLPAVESMATGCPVIGLATGAMPETVGAGGILTRETVGDVTGAMFRIASSPRLRKTLGVAGMRISNRYTWDSFTGHVVGELEKTGKMV